MNVTSSGGRCVGNPVVSIAIHCAVRKGILIPPSILKNHVSTGTVPTIWNYGRSKSTMPKICSVNLRGIVFPVGLTGFHLVWHIL